MQNPQEMAVRLLLMSEAYPPPNRVTPGVGGFGSNVSVHRAGVSQYAPSADGGLARADNSVRPRSIGSGRDQAEQGGYADTPPVAAGPLFGQPNYAAPVAGTSMFARHVNPIDASVRGPRFVAMSPQSISTPIVSQPIPVVCQVATPPVSVATPPVQVVVSASGTFVPAFVSPFDGTGAIPSHGSGIPPNSAIPLGSGIPPNSTVPPSSGIPPSSAVTSVPLGLAVPTVPATPTVPPVPSVPWHQRFHPCRQCRRHCQFRQLRRFHRRMVVHRSVGPGANGVIAMVGDTGQAMMGSYVPNSAGYMGPWMWGTSGPVPIGLSLIHI